MIVPFILTLLQPLCPALFMRETLRWLIGSVGGWLIDEDYAGWLRESRDKQELRSLLSFVLMIEEGLDLLIHVRARQKLGHKARPGRRRKPRPDPSIGNPSSFEDICRRFERACLKFADVERLADRRALKLQRFLDQAAGRLDLVHHPVADPAGAGGVVDVVVGVGVGGVGGDVAPAGRTGQPSAQPIRGPPGLGLSSANPAPAQPAVLTLAAPKRSEGGCEIERLWPKRP